MKRWQVCACLWGFIFTIVNGEVLALKTLGLDELPSHISWVDEHRLIAQTGYEPCRLWILDIRNGQTNLVVKAPSVHTFLWSLSPDRKSLLLISPQWVIWQTVDGKRKIHWHITPNRPPVALAWRSSGKQIAIAFEEKFGIYTGGVYTLPYGKLLVPFRLSVNAWLSDLKWNRSEAALLFFCSYDEKKFVVRLDLRSRSQKVYRGEIPRQWHFSRDRRFFIRAQEIAKRSRPYEPTHYAVWLQDLKEKTRQQILKGKWVAVEPIWSPDGHYCAIFTVHFVNCGEDSDVYIFRRQNGTVRQMAKFKGKFSVPTTKFWSPDSNRLLLLNHWDAEAYRPFILHTHSGKLSPLTLGKGYDVIFSDKNTFAWSPSGKQLAMTLCASISNRQYWHGLWIFRWDKPNQLHPKHFCVQKWKAKD